MRYDEFMNKHLSIKNKMIACELEEKLLFAQLESEYIALTPDFYFRIFRNTSCLDPSYFSFAFFSNIEHVLRVWDGSYTSEFGDVPPDIEAHITIVMSKYNEWLAGKTDWPFGPENYKRIQWDDVIKSRMSN